MKPLAGLFVFEMTCNVSSWALIPIITYCVVCCAELSVSQRQTDANQQRLWTELSAHIASIHSRQLNTAVTAATDSSAELDDLWSQRVSECVHGVGLSTGSQAYASHSGLQSSLANVCGTVSKAGTF